MCASAKINEYQSRDLYSDNSYGSDWNHVRWRVLRMLLKAQFGTFGLPNPKVLNHEENLSNFFDGLR